MKAYGVVITLLISLLVISAYIAQSNKKLAEAYITCFAPASVWQVIAIQDGRIDIQCEAHPEIEMYGYEIKGKVEVGQKMELY